MLLTWCWWRHLHPPCAPVIQESPQCQPAHKYGRFFCCHAPMLKGIDIYSWKLSCIFLLTMFFSLLIIPLAYKRLRKWWNETIVPQFFPRLSSSVFSCLQASFDLEEDEYSTIYLYFSLRHFQEFHLMYIYRRLYNICTIYSTNLTEVRKDGSKSTFGLTFFEGNNKDSDIHPTFKKKLTLKPKKKVMSSHEEWSPLRESLCLGVPCHNQPDMQSGKLNRFAAPETVKVGRSRSGFLLGWVLVTFQGWNC